MSNDYKKKDNILQEKAFLFASKTIALCNYLQGEQQETVISKQLYRSATSIGANLAEAAFSESRADLKHRFSIALKEANESEYWLRLVVAIGYNYNGINEIIDLCRDIKYLLIASIKTIVKNSKKKR